MSDVRTRIAPSPTGEDLHIGNVYTGLMNWAYARKNKGQFVIRIEDTDRERFVTGAIEKILATLKSFQLNYDEGPDIGGPFAPYLQSERLNLYKKYADELIEKGLAYYCFCTKERLDELRRDQISKKQTPRYDRYCLTNATNSEERIKNGDKYVIRLKVPENRDISFTDLIRGEIKINSRDLDDQVLLKSDGYPTYHLGVVVDDHVMEISHIIRAEEWISSTPKHILLYEAFEWKLPIFAHVPILRNPDHSKLSKRKNPVWATWYLEEGFLPEAVLNYLALLGWSHPEEKEIFSMEEFTSLFDIKDLKPVGPVFDLTKLEWVNSVYIQEVLSLDDLTKRLAKYSTLKDQFSDKEFTEIVALARTRMKKLIEFDALVKPFLEPEHVELSEEEKKQKEVLKERLEKLENWNATEIFNILKGTFLDQSIRFPTIYKILLGTDRGLPIADMLAILGKEKSIAL